MDFFPFFAFATLMYTAVLVGSSLLIVAALIYVVLRSREAKEGLQDPQLGMKVVVNLLLSLSVLLMASGAAMVAGDIANSAFGMDSSSRSRSQFSRSFGMSSRGGGTMRTGFGLALSGSMLTGLYSYMLVSRTNHKRWPMCFRAFTGYRAALAGLFFSAAFAQTMVAGLQGEGVSTRSQMMAVSAAYTFVWGIALAAEFMLLKASSQMPNTPSVRLRCRACGTELQNDPQPDCPSCGAELPIALRRKLSQRSAPNSTPQEAPLEIGPPPKPHPLD